MMKYQYVLLQRYNARCRAEYNVIKFLITVLSYISSVDNSAIMIKINMNN